jgi:hypothetical protein
MVASAKGGQGQYRVSIRFDDPDSIAEPMAITYRLGGVEADRRCSSLIGGAKMSDPGASFGAARGRNADNPMIDFITAACNAWTVGLSVFQVIARQTGAAATARPDREAGGDPLSALIGISAGLATALSDMVAQRPELPSAGALGSNDPAEETDLASLMVQTLMIGAASTLRYWLGLVGIYVKHQPVLMQSLARRAMNQSSTSETEDLLLVDALRAGLREIGDVAVQEARRLDTELEQTGEAVARAVDEPGVPAAYRRRWKAKD